MNEILPWKRLMMAIICRAVMDTASQNEKLSREAWDWLTSPETQAMADTLEITHTRVLCGASYEEFRSSVRSVGVWQRLQLE